MSMEYEKICCVCLTSTCKLHTLSQPDENKIILQHKLKTCISEIEWLDSYQICGACTNLLNVIYVFRETCLKSELTRRQKLEEKKDEVNEIKEETTEEENNLKLEEVQLDIKDETCSEYQEAISEYASLRDFEPRPDEDEFEFKKKLREKTDNLQFACGKCDNVFNSSTGLIDHCTAVHRMRARDVRPFLCEQCPIRFCNFSLFLRHMKYHDAQANPYICKFCGKEYFSKRGLDYHENRHINERGYSCRECGKCFNTSKGIRSHELRVHTDPSNWKYCCLVCFKQFPEKSPYDSHMRSHSENRTFNCHLCEATYAHREDLKRHLRTHSNVGEYKCQHCDKKYKDPIVLKYHMAKIHGISIGEAKLPLREKKHTCHICPRTFFMKYKLQRHLYTHAREKAFECATCGEKFTSKTDITQHFRDIHNLYKMHVEHESNKGGFGELA